MNTTVLILFFLSSSSPYSVALLLVAHCSVDMIFTVLFHSSFIEPKIHFSTLEVVLLCGMNGPGHQFTNHRGKIDWVCSFGLPIENMSFKVIIQCSPHLYRV